MKEVKMKICVELTEIETKALAWKAYSPQEWVENVAKDFARRAMQEIFELEVARMAADPEITSIPANVEEVVANADIESAKDRTDRFHSEIGL